jgi:hypothetical protein
MLIKAIQLGVMVAAIFATVAGGMKAAGYYQLKDPVAARYARIDTECAKPTPDGSRREIVYLDENNRNGGYVPCPRKN